MVEEVAEIENHTTTIGEGVVAKVNHVVHLIMANLNMSFKDTLKIS